MWVLTGGTVQRGDEGRNLGDKKGNVQSGGGRFWLGEGQGTAGSFHRPPHGTGEEIRRDILSTNNRHIVEPREE